MKIIQTKNCKVCDKTFYKVASCSQKNWDKVRRFCSVSCSKLGNTNRRGKTHPNIWNKGKKGLQVAWNKGNGEYAKKLGFGLWMTGKTQSIETRQKKSDKMRGDKAPNWQGGITAINNTIRRSLKYRLWREAIFNRDNWTCIWCKTRGCELNADHILPFAKFPEWRFEINNGRTLCVPCHQTTNTYKGKTH